MEEHEKEFEEYDETTLSLSSSNLRFVSLFVLTLVAAALFGYFLIIVSLA